MILVDTSVWIDHLHSGDARMVALLDSEAVLLHPFVLAEIALGSLKNRKTLFLELQTAPRALMASNEDVMTLIERQKLYGSGIGLVDAHLLASTLLDSDHLLWTKDKRLAAVAERLGIDAAMA